MLLAVVGLSLAVAAGSAVGRRRAAARNARLLAAVAAYDG
jgi:hypothetical protein